MRRNEREKDRKFATSVIDGCGYMVLAMTGADGRPYCVPLSPVRWDDWIYFHCALEGEKLDALRANPQVCMSFVGDGAAYPAGKFTAYYSSAVAFGTAREVTDAAEKMEALRRLTLKYGPADMEAFDSAFRRYCAHTSVWKISLDKVTGKKNPPGNMEKGT